MANRLSNMVIKQVHLVGSPANRREYLIVKNTEGNNMAEDVEKAAKAKAEADAAAAAKAKAEEDAEGEGKNKMMKSISDLEQKLGAKDAALIKSALDILKSSDSEVAKTSAAALEAQLEGKTVEKSNKTTEAEVTDVIKSQMPDIVKAISEPLTKALDETKKELDDVKKSNALLIGERTEREITEIAKSLVGDIEKNTEHVRLMKSQLTPEGFEAFVKRERENSEVIRKSPMFREVGSSGGTGTTHDDPYKELTEIANSMVQKSNDKLGFNDAFAKACAERPDLYDSYRTGSYANSSYRED